MNLTDSEKQKLDAKYVENRRRLIDLKSNLEKERFEVELLLDTTGVDRDKIMKHYEDMENARIELSKERFRMLMDVRDTIGPERFQTLKSMHKERKKRRKDSRDRYGEDKNYREKEKN